MSWGESIGVRGLFTSGTAMVIVRDGRRGQWKLRIAGLWHIAQQEVVLGSIPGGLCCSFSVPCFVSLTSLSLNHAGSVKQTPQKLPATLSNTVFLN